MSLSYIQGSSHQSNRPSAWSDWTRAIELAKQQHKLHLVEKLQISSKFGVKRIDATTCKILQVLGVTKEEACSLGFGCYYQWEKAQANSVGAS